MVMRYRKRKSDGHQYEKLTCDNCFMEHESILTGIPNVGIARYVVYGTNPKQSYTCYLCRDCRRELDNLQLIKQIHKNSVHKFKLKVLVVKNEEEGWEKMD